MFPQSSKHLAKRITWLLSRVAWGVMLTAHTWWFVRSIGSPDAWLGQQVALALAIGFFALKAYDLPALRLQLSRHGVVSCIVIVALLHAGAIDRASDGDGSPMLWTLPLIGLVPLCPRPGILAYIRRCLLRAAVIGHVPLTWTQRYWHRCARVLIRRHQQFLVALSTPRAPPV